MSFPLAASLRTAIAAFLQISARRLSLIAMALLAALVVAGPVRAQTFSLVQTTESFASTVSGSFESGSFTLTAVAPNAEYLSNGNSFVLDYNGTASPTDKLVTFTWGLNMGYASQARFSVTINGVENVVTQGGTGSISGGGGARLRANDRIGFRIYGPNGTQLTVTSITVTDSPSISSLNRNTGSRSGGDLSNQVIIYGSGFTADSTV